MLCGIVALAVPSHTAARPFLGNDAKMTGETTRWITTSKLPARVENEEDM
jgi:hypothetical protein